MEADPEQTEKIECGLIFRSIGYFGVPVEEGIPYDHQKGIVPNIDGFVEPGMSSSHVFTNFESTEYLCFLFLKVSKSRKQIILFSHTK